MLEISLRTHHDRIESIVQLKKENILIVVTAKQLTFIVKDYPGEKILFKEAASGLHIPLDAHVGTYILPEGDHNHGVLKASNEHTLTEREDNPVFVKEMARKRKEYKKMYFPGQPDVEEARG